MPLMEIVIASTNLHKVRELREMFKSQFDIEVLSLLDFPDYSSPKSLPQDFKANSTTKASHAAQALNRWVLADDSGLVIPALQSDPKSPTRYEGTKDTTPANRAELLEKMQAYTHLKRAAYYICSLALAGPQGLKKTVTAQCEGLILTQERGNRGFGFDTLFIKHDYDKSFGELDETSINRISHRRKAFDKMLPTLESLFK
jgi:XTP/dITP diphosphohydrolase